MNEIVYDALQKAVAGNFNSGGLQMKLKNHKQHVQEQHEEFKMQYELPKVTGSMSYVNKPCDGHTGKTVNLQLSHTYLTQ